MMTALKSEVRPVTLAEVPKVLDFLLSGWKQLAHRTPDELRPSFEYRWTVGVDKPNLGFALWSADQVVGFLGAIYAERPLQGRLVKVCNLSAWYVRDDFRGAGVKLLLAAISQKDYCFTTFTSSNEVSKILDALKFTVIDDCKRVYLPWHYGREMLRWGSNVDWDPEKIAPVLQGDDRQFLRDHLPYRVKHYLLRSGDEYSYLILKRRLVPGEVALHNFPIEKARLMWYPSMEVLYLRNPQLALKNWGGLVATILRRERVLAVVAPERFFSSNAVPAGNPWRHRSFLLARTPIDGTMDSLYSELVVLPF